MKIDYTNKIEAICHVNSCVLKEEKLERQTPKIYTEYKTLSFFFSLLNLNDFKCESNLIVYRLYLN